LTGFRVIFFIEVVGNLEKISVFIENLRMKVRFTDSLKVSWAEIANSLRNSGSSLDLGLYFDLTTSIDRQGLSHFRSSSSFGPRLKPKLVALPN
jgi:hypothetical protein